MSKIWSFIQVHYPHCRISSLVQCPQCGVLLCCNVHNAKFISAPGSTMLSSSLLQRPQCEVSLCSSVHNGEFHSAQVNAMGVSLQSTIPKAMFHSAPVSTWRVSLCFCVHNVVFISAFVSTMCSFTLIHYPWCVASLCSSVHTAEFHCALVFHSGAAKVWSFTLVNCL